MINLRLSDAWMMARNREPGFLDELLDCTQFEKRRGVLLIDTETFRALLTRRTIDPAIKRGIVVGQVEKAKCC